MELIFFKDTLIAIKQSLSKIENTKKLQKLKTYLFPVVIIHFLQKKTVTYNIRIDISKIYINKSD